MLSPSSLRLNRLFSLGGIFAEAQRHRRSVKLTSRTSRRAKCIQQPLALGRQHGGIDPEILGAVAARRTYGDRGREMDTFLIIGICFLCYEMCDLIRRYSAPQAIETHRTAAASAASPSQKVYSISRKIQGPPACCPQ